MSELKKYNKTFLNKKKVNLDAEQSQIDNDATVVPFANNKGLLFMCVIVKGGPFMCVIFVKHYLMN